jgi:hypothetical protein
VRYGARVTNATQVDADLVNTWLVPILSRPSGEQTRDALAQ